MFKENKAGWSVLVSSAFLQLFLGVIYAWGVFVLPVAEAFGWHIEAVQLTASFTVGFFTVGTFTGGKLQLKLGAAKVVMIGGFLMTAGMAFAAITPTSHPWLIYMTYGVMGGIGSGMGYMPILTAAQKWFPKQRGLATGISVGTFGLSVTLLAPVLRTLLENFSPQTVFLIMSGSFFLVTLVFGRLIKFPVEAVETTNMLVNYDESKQMMTSEMVKTKEFYLLFAALFLICVAFFVINPAIVPLTLERGFDVGFATGIIMMTGVGNTLGRLVIPVFTNKVKIEWLIVGLFAILTIAAGMLTTATGILFVIMVMLVPICFGAAMSLWPLIVADYFGVKHLGANYGAVGFGFSTSALFMPGLIALLGDYSIRFIAVSVLSLCGMLTMLPLLLMAKRKVD